MSNTRKPYAGSSRALVVALDVGTTFSGVSYAILEPGEVPKIHGVTRFPGQEHVAGNSKIPSIIYYDGKGITKAAGAEADSSQIVAQAEDEGWMKVELFKLRLRPKTMKLDMNGMKMSPLPKGKTSGDVFGDFLRYLFQCTTNFIQDTHANGAALWKAVEGNTHFVLSHPNGWEGAQQSRMRQSAISGGLIPNTDEGKSKITFVTEGEASLHACILNGLAAETLSEQPGSGFIVADAGGGTLDISSYAIKRTSPLIIEEIAPPDCMFAGAVFVSRRARVFLEEKLKFSKYGTPDALDHITKRFDETTKRLFRDSNDPQFIPFGSPLDKDLKVGIRGGQLKLTGAEVAELFEPSIEAAVASIVAQIQASAGAIKAVWLVGGFAANHWLFTQLQSRLAPFHVTINRPDTQTSKAVADGAVGFFCDHHVSARMSKYMYGVEYLREMDMADREHVNRQGRLMQMPSGPKLLPDAFDCILAKNVRVKESSVFLRKYYTEVTKVSTLSLFEIEIWCYRGVGDDVPKWIDRQSDQFGSLCFVQADLSKLSSSAQLKVGANAQTYWTVVFSIEIHFGLTEFKARIKWNDDGEIRYGPATIIYNERGSRSEEDDLATLPDDDLHTTQTTHGKHDKRRSAPVSRSLSKDTTVEGSSHSIQADATSGAKSDDEGQRSRKKSKSRSKEVALDLAAASGGDPAKLTAHDRQKHPKRSGSASATPAASPRVAPSSNLPEESVASDREATTAAQESSSPQSTEISESVSASPSQDGTSSEFTLQSTGGEDSSASSNPSAPDTDAVSVEKGIQFIVDDAARENDDQDKPLSASSNQSPMLTPTITVQAAESSESDQGNVQESSESKAEGERGEVEVHEAKAADLVLNDKTPEVDGQATGKPDQENMLDVTPQAEGATTIIEGGDLSAEVTKASTPPPTTALQPSLTDVPSDGTQRSVVIPEQIALPASPMAHSEPGGPQEGERPSKDKIPPSPLKPNHEVRPVEVPASPRKIETAKTFETYPSDYFLQGATASISNGSVLRFSPRSPPAAASESRGGSLAPSPLWLTPLATSSALPSLSAGARSPRAGYTHLAFTPKAPSISLPVESGNGALEALVTDFLPQRGGTEVRDDHSMVKSRTPSHTAPPSPVKPSSKLKKSKGSRKGRATVVEEENPTKDEETNNLGYSEADGGWYLFGDD